MDFPIIGRNEKSLRDYREEVLDHWMQLHLLARNWVLWIHASCILELLHLGPPRLPVSPNYSIDHVVGYFFSLLFLLSSKMYHWWTKFINTLQGFAGSLAYSSFFSPSASLADLHNSLTNLPRKQNNHCQYTVTFRSFSHRESTRNIASLPYPDLLL